MIHIILNILEYLQSCYNNQDFLEYKFPTVIKPMQQIFETSYMLLRCFEYDEKYIHLIWYAIHELIMSEFNEVTSENIKKCAKKYSLDIDNLSYSHVIEEAKEHPEDPDFIFNETCEQIAKLANKILLSSHVTHKDWQPIDKEYFDSYDIFNMNQQSNPDIHDVVYPRKPVKII